MVLRFLIGCLGAEIKTALKTVNSWRALRFWSAPIFCDFLVWQAKTTRPGQCWRQSTHISWPAGCSWHSGGNQSLQEENTSKEQREASHWTFARPNSKEMLHYSELVYIQLTPIFQLLPILYGHLYFVDAYIFISAKILGSASIFGFIATVNVVYM